MTAVFVLVALFLSRQALLLIDLWTGGYDEAARVTERVLVGLGRASLAPTAESSRSLPPTAP